MLTSVDRGQEMMPVSIMSPNDAMWNESPRRHPSAASRFSAAESDERRFCFLTRSFAIQVR
jgi:hypothetical protein